MISEQTLHEEYLVCQYLKGRYLEKTAQTEEERRTRHNQVASLEELEHVKLLCNKYLK